MNVVGGAAMVAVFLAVAGMGIATGQGAVIAAGPDDCRTLCEAIADHVRAVAAPQAGTKSPF